MSPPQRVFEELSTPAHYKSFLSQYDSFLLDCDGVLWQGNVLLPNILKALHYLRHTLGKRLIFVSNNSTKSRAQYATKFRKLGIEASEDEIFGSSYAAAIYLSRVLKFPKDKKVYVLGESGVEAELESEGIQFVGGTNKDERREITEEDYSSIKPDQSVGAVLCALDTHINYLKLSRALTYLRQPNTHFLSTNTDSTYPTHNSLFPGAGTTTTIPLQYASGRQSTNCGKPSQTMMDAIFSKYNLDRKSVCMVGDRLDTDIRFGNEGGLGGTLLVLTGVSKLEDCERQGIWPKFVMDGLGDLAKLESED